MKKVDFNRIISYFNFGGFEDAKTNVVRDWKIILAVFAVILMAVILFDGYVFWKYQREAECEIEIAEIDIGIDKEALQRVIEGIEKRDAEFNAKFSAPLTEDPSL